MPRPRYLADTSVFARLTKKPVATAFAPLAAAAQVAVCSPVAFELGYSARNRHDYEDLAMGRFRAKVRNSPMGGTPGGIIAASSAATSSAYGGSSGAIRAIG